MPDFRIFTESIADVKFLLDYIKEIFDTDLLKEDFDTLGGWSGYKSVGKLKASIIENGFNEKKTILILDADADFLSRQEEVKNDFTAFGQHVELFLFPNDKGNGNIESLLAEIATNRKIMDCFLEYEKCVSGHPKPLNDSRIYSYLDMLLHPNPKDETGNDLRKEEYRNYRNKDHWNLNHEYLNSLKEFLTIHISN